MSADGGSDGTNDGRAHLNSSVIICWPSLRIHIQIYTFMRKNCKYPKIYFKRLFRSYFWLFCWSFCCYKIIPQNYDYVLCVHNTIIILYNLRRWMTTGTSWQHSLLMWRLIAVHWCFQKWFEVVAHLRKLMVNVIQIVKKWAQLFGHLAFKTMQLKRFSFSFEHF